MLAKHRCLSFYELVAFVLLACFDFHLIVDKCAFSRHIAIFPLNLKRIFTHGHEETQGITFVEYSSGTEVEIGLSTLGK